MCWNFTLTQGRSTDQFVHTDTKLKSHRGPFVSVAADLACGNSSLLSGISLGVANYKGTDYCHLITLLCDGVKYSRRHGSSAHLASGILGGQQGEEGREGILDGRASVPLESLCSSFNSCLVYKGRFLSPYLRARRGSIRGGIRRLLNP